MRRMLIYFKDLFKTSKNFTNVQSILNHHGFSVYLVGGMVRDRILGIDSSNDYDLATNASLDDIVNIFGEDTVIAGQTFKVAYVNNIEVSPFRGEDIVEDLCNRDLTINAIAVDINGKFIDPLNGIEDIIDKKIRLCNDETTIQQDPLRIIRACRFLSLIEGEFDKKTYEILRENRYLVKKIPKERIQVEFKKAMKLKHPSLFFGALYSIGVLEYILPELSECVMYPHGKFHKETIWEHCMIVGDSISSKYPLLRLAGFLHDIGKPKAHKENNYVNFKRHDTIGSEIVRDFMEEYKFSNNEILYVEGLVRLHMMTVKNCGKPAMRRFMRKLNDYNIHFKDWIRHKIADRKGNLRKDDLSFSDIKEMYKKFDISEEVVFKVTDLDISGGEIIDIFNLKPGPLVGKIQRHLVDFVLETGLNKREYLINETHRFFQNYIMNTDD